MDLRWGFDAAFRVSMPLPGGTSLDQKRLRFEALAAAFGVSPPDHGRPQVPGFGHSLGPRALMPSLARAELAGVSRDVALLIEDADLAAKLSIHLRKLAVFGRDHVTVSVRGHPLFQSRHSAPKIVGNVMPRNPAGQRDPNRILAKFVSPAWARDSSVSLNITLSKQRHQTATGPYHLPRPSCRKNPLPSNEG